MSSDPPSTPAADMASLHKSSCWDPLSLVLIFMISAALLDHAAVATSITQEYPAIFVFGDSLSDAGNRAIASNSSSFRTLQLPYGETFPGWPFGRFSDGHTLVDFLAMYMGLPLMSPYLNSSADFGAGVNYAVGGATALNTSFLYSLDIHSPTNLSLDVQLAFHLAYKASVESSNGSLHGSPTRAVFEEGLYVIEIGGNDQNYAYAAKYSPYFVNSTFIPLIIHKVGNVVETLLDNGAKHILFVSITPLGCTPSMLAQFDGVKDSDGCLEEYNFASYLYGEYLHEEAKKLRASYPDASFLFMDYYGAFKHVLKEKETFGFANTLDACCGAGDDYAYNYNPLETCNINSISICANPNAYMNWDGVHFTNYLNSQIFNQTFILGSYLDNPYSSVL